MRLAAECDALRAQLGEHMDRLQRLQHDYDTLRVEHEALLVRHEQATEKAARDDTGPLLLRLRRSETKLRAYDADRAAMLDTQRWLRRWCLAAFALAIALLVVMVLRARTA